MKANRFVLAAVAALCGIWLSIDILVKDVDAGLVSVHGTGIQAEADWGDLRSAETYAGYDRADNFASPGGMALDRNRLYAAPDRLGLDTWALSGEWTVGREAARLQRANGRIVYRFHARDLHLVMGADRARQACAVSRPHRRAAARACARRRRR